MASAFGCDRCSNKLPRTMRMISDINKRKVSYLLGERDDSAAMSSSSSLIKTNRFKKRTGTPMIRLHIGDCNAMIDDFEINQPNRCSPNMIDRWLVFAALAFSREHCGLRVVHHDAVTCDENNSLP